VIEQRIRAADRIRQAHYYACRHADVYPEDDERWQWMYDQVFEWAMRQLERKR